jgi:hypothetical protein
MLLGYRMASRWGAAVVWSTRRSGDVLGQLSRSRGVANRQFLAQFFI